MRKPCFLITACCCLLASAVLAQGTTRQKPGLWEVTTQMTMNGAGMPQMPAGVKLPPGMQAGGPFGGHTSQVCVTQAMIDKYGGPYSNPQRGNCQLSDVSVKSSGMSAKLTCTGQFEGTGTVESTFTDGNTTRTTIHMTGTSQMGQSSRPVDVTMQSTATYKGADCGSVQPAPLPVTK